MVRDTDNMVSTSQVVMDLTARVFHLYIIPGKVEYLGYVDDLPKGYKPKLKLKIYEYTDLDGDGKFDVIRRKKAHGGLLPLQEPAFNLREVTKHLILLEDHLLHVDRRCPDCIWKHLLTAEAFADEADTLDGDNPAPPTLSADIRALGVALRDGTDLAVVGQRARAIRKALVPTVARGKVAAGAVTIEDVVHAGVGDLLVMLEDDFPGVALAWRRVGPSKTAWVRVIPNGGGWVPSADRVRPGEEFLGITRLLMRGRRFRLERGA
jgi:hypothetical protein